MSKISKIPLYLRTVTHLKPSQVFLRIKRRMGGLTKLKGAPGVREDSLGADISRVSAMPELDFCPDFLKRFDADQILRDEICILHHTENVNWDTSWHEQLSTPLWRFNLQYFEYLLPLAKAYRDTADIRYMEKGKEIICSWIDACPREKGGPAWDSYPISLRIINWLAFYAELEDELSHDSEFIQRMNSSLNGQYVHLSKHLEVDLLANHYLENLKALVVLACYFDDQMYFRAAYEELKRQVAEQVLADGMHYELSPMYHKIVFEDLMRVAACVRAFEPDIAVEKELKLQEMCDCLYSMEHAANRTPLFNDAGDNVSKSKESLLSCAKSVFSIDANYRNQLPNAGYVFLERQTSRGFVKVVFDAGQAGPDYAMGHAHCDALSVECFIDGVPWIVNKGTFAYQNENRLAYKSTGSHSTIVLDGEEQYECWAPFRVARFGTTRLLAADETVASAEFCYASGKKVRREICLTDEGLKIVDVSNDARARSVFHLASGWEPLNLRESKATVAYAPEFGKTQSATSYFVPLDGMSVTFLPFPRRVEASKEESEA